MLREVAVTRLIIEDYFRRLTDHLEVDAAICGGGPAGLVAGADLARAGLKVALFDRKVSLGGGMWGGGMFFNTCVVQPEAEDVLREFGIRYREAGGLLAASAVECVARLVAGAAEAGVEIFNGITVEDVAVFPAADGRKRVGGFVVNWGTVGALAARGIGIEVDPLVIASRWSLDATGHPHEVCRIAREKGLELNTPTGTPVGEGSLWMDAAERLVVENSREVFPGLFVCGMAANAVFGAPRMGPIFGGMLLSGKKVAERILDSNR